MLTEEGWQRRRGGELARATSLPDRVRTAPNATAPLIFFAAEGDVYGQKCGPRLATASPSTRLVAPFRDRACSLLVSAPTREA
jgi:hypothetical protein